MLDIQAIIDRHLTDEKMQGKTFYEGHIVIDLYNAIEEVKRLRDHRESCHANLLKGYETGKNEERAAVVAWLRDGVVPEYEAVALGWARAIERGEHLKETS